jgi:hypothetical protein
MKETIAWWALLLSIGSFALYLLTTLVQLISQLKAGAAADPSKAALPNVTSLLMVIKDLAEALSKASPSLVALLASLAYLAMAGFAAGAFGTG